MTKESSKRLARIAAVKAWGIARYEKIENVWIGVSRASVKGFCILPGEKVIRVEILRIGKAKPARKVKP